MFNLSNISNRFVAAFGSLAVTAFVFAVAIAPANQGAVLPMVA